MKPSIKSLAARMLLSLVVVMATAPVSAATGWRGKDCPASAGACATVSAAVQTFTGVPGGAVFRQASRGTATYTIFLPLISKAPPGLYGNVTLNGVAASGVTLQLWRTSGSAFDLVDINNTALDGAYAFIGEAALGAGESYNVQFLNSASSADGRLEFWLTRAVTTYAAGQSAPIGNFDLADITLQSPAPGATVGVPTTFSWMTRPAIPYDDYQVRLQLNASARYTTPRLGYVGTYQLNSLPSGFNPGTQYGWSVLVNSPDGGFGGSFYSRNITFSNSGQSASQPVLSNAEPERVPFLERVSR